MFNIVGLLVLSLVIIALWELEFLQKPFTAVVTLLVLVAVVLAVWSVAGSTLATIPTANVIQHRLPIETSY